MLDGLPTGVAARRVFSSQAAEAGAVALLGKETPPDTIAAQLLAAAEGRVGWSVE